MRITKLLICIISALFLGSSLSMAQGLATPDGPVILTISGNIKNTNQGQEAQFDLAMLEAFGLKETTVTTPWTDGEVTFKGPLLRDILAKTGATGTILKGTALNDYSVELPMSDVEDYDVILAMSLNGKKLSIRDKGPLWIIYPWGENSELEKEIYYSRSIWQLVHIEVK